MKSSMVVAILCFGAVACGEGDEYASTSAGNPPHVQNEEQVSLLTSVLPLGSPLLNVVVVPSPANENVAVSSAGVSKTDANLLSPVAGRKSSLASSLTPPPSPKPHAPFPLVSSNESSASTNSDGLFVISPVAEKKFSLEGSLTPPLSPFPGISGDQFTASANSVGSPATPDGSYQRLLNHTVDNNLSLASFSSESATTPVTPLPNQSERSVEKLEELAKKHSGLLNLAVGNTSSLESRSSDPTISPAKPVLGISTKQFLKGEDIVGSPEILTGTLQNSSNPAVGSRPSSVTSDELISTFPSPPTFISKSNVVPSSIKESSGSLPSDYYNFIRDRLPVPEKELLARRCSSPSPISPTSPISNVSGLSPKERRRSIEVNYANQPVERHTRHYSSPPISPNATAAALPTSNLKANTEHSSADKISEVWRPSSVYNSIMQSYENLPPRRSSLPAYTASSGAIAAPSIQPIQQEEKFKISNFINSYHDLKSNVFDRLATSYSLFGESYSLSSNDSEEKFKLQMYFEGLPEPKFLEKEFSALNEYNLAKNAERVLLVTEFDIESENVEGVEDFQKKDYEFCFLILFHYFEEDNKWYKYAMVGDQPSWKEVEDDHFEHWFETGAQFVQFTSDELKTLLAEEAPPSSKGLPGIPEEEEEEAEVGLGIFYAK